MDRFLSIVFRGVLAFTLGGPAAASDSYDTVARPFFEEHCLRCHGEKRQKGDFRIDSLPRDFLHGDVELWAEGMGRINAAEMPPPEEPQPAAADIRRVVDWIGRRIREGERARMARRPAVAHYRLSRDEYAHTVHDLLGVHYDPAAPGEMTEDPDWHGFRRIGSQLSLSPSHVEKYLQAAEKILEAAYPGKEPEAKTWKKDALTIDWSNRQKRDVFEEQGVLDDIRTLLWPGHELGYVGPVHSRHPMPPGIYRARIQLSGLATPDGRAPHLAIYAKQHDRMLFEQDVLAPEHEPVVLEFETFLSGASRISIENAVAGPSNSQRPGRPTSQFVLTTLDDPKSRAPWQRKLTDEEGNALFPLLIFDWIEWEGPIVKDRDRERRARFWPNSADDPDQVRASLERFAEHAWRRPVTRAEIDRYLAIVHSEREAGESFRDSYLAGMLGVLASKNFSYLVEGSPSDFLWSSLPDRELREAARAGTLHEPDVLRRQVARMLDDPRIDRFTDAFPRQWLQLDRVGMFPPDPKLYPDYDRWLEKSMILETTGFFAEVFRQNRSIREFLDSDWTLLNPRLARHYGIDIPPASGFQRVALEPEHNRGGLLTQASALSLSSDGTRHRPVHRGVWVSEAILGVVPNPPPANVDAIEPNPVDAPKATIRDKLEAHTVHSNCRSCHRTIDPLGFAFDNYDAIGRWRTVETVAKGKGPDPPVDATGTLPDGRRFSGPGEFKALLLEDADAFAEALVEKLATFALRRAMTVDDRDALRQIATTTREDGYRLRDLIEALVLSELFRKR